MDDLISRQDAINAADRADYTGLAVEDVKKVTDEVVKEIKKLPSVQPKTGKWIVLDNCSNAGIYCSVCNNKIFGYTHKPKKKHSRYCPSCGARMDAERKEL